MKRLLAIFFILIPLAMSAQVQFGYLSYQSIIKEMPEYAKVQQDLANLKAKYEAESTRGEEEFQKKFLDFLHGQKDFPQTIMQKRQAELQALMDNGVAFRLKIQSLMAQAEKDMMGEVQKRLNRALLEVGVEFGYGFILNTDDNSCPYINPVVGVDVSELVRQKLGIAKAVEPNAQSPGVQPVQNPQPAIQPVEAVPVIQVQ